MATLESSMSLKFDMEMFGDDAVAPVEHDRHNFHSELIRLIMKADGFYRARLFAAFPNTSKVFQAWEAQVAIPDLPYEKGHGEMVTDAVERGKSEILADISTGLVPAKVRDFSHLHDFVDANEYGGRCGRCRGPSSRPSTLGVYVPLDGRLAR
ncbi:hypothetical protein LCGC14_2447050 [marine sediment metagenome]|uniref:Uncharacterized protein n=1 Tax=marine sediment metagenome TaxID=412755 RepID=A0A0F9C4T2_9ZZZZ